MKELFPGYYRPTPEEFDDVWKKATFVFDANVLLHIHRRSKQTRRAILDTLKKLGERLWIPYEIAAEYQRNKLKVAHGLVDSCKTVLNGLAGLQEQLRSRDLREHPFLNAEALTKSLDELTKQVEEARETSRSFSLDDPDSLELASLFRGRLDEPYSGDALTKKIEEAKTRGKAKIPPGYKDFDSKTDDVRAGGDALIWFKLIDRAKEKQCPIILVTDDQKEDWWWTHQGLTHGPRPELGQEMWSLAQQRFYMYTLSKFLELSGKYLGQNVPVEVVKDVKAHEQEQKVQTSSAAHSRINSLWARTRYARALSRAREIREARDEVAKRLALAQAKIIEDPYSPNGIDDRREVDALQEQLSMLELDFDQAVLEAQLAKTVLTGGA
jgi:predicted nucleic acid-binding protein